MLELLSDPQAWIALLTLTALELVLGIDNIVFISILVDKLPAEQQKKARPIGLFLAMFMRVGLLMILSWIIGLTAAAVQHHVRQSGDLGARPDPDRRRPVPDLEEHRRDPPVDRGRRSGHATTAVKAAFVAVILQIIVVDMVFSLDSIITAVGMVRRARR